MSYALAPQNLIAAKSLNGMFAAPDVPIRPANAVAGVNPWSLLPPLGNLDAYI